MDTFNSFSELAAANQDYTCDSNSFVTNMPQGFPRPFRQLELGHPYMFNLHPAQNNRCSISATNMADATSEPFFLTDYSNITSAEAIAFRDKNGKFQQWKFSF